MQRHICGRAARGRHPAGCHRRIETGRKTEKEKYRETNGKLGAPETVADEPSVKADGCGCAKKKQKASTIAIPEKITRQNKQLIAKKKIEMCVHSLFPGDKKGKKSGTAYFSCH